MEIWQHIKLVWFNFQSLWFCRLILCSYSSCFDATITVGFSSLHRGFNRLCWWHRLSCNLSFVCYRTRCIRPRASLPCLSPSTTVMWSTLLGLVTLTQRAKGSPSTTTDTTPWGRWRWVSLVCHLWKWSMLSVLSLVTLLFLYTAELLPRPQSRSWRLKTTGGFRSCFIPAPTSMIHTHTHTVWFNQKQVMLCGIWDPDVPCAEGHWCIKAAAV